MTGQLDREDPLGFDVGSLPVGVAKTVQTHRATGRRRMHETPFTDVDTGMADLAAAIGGEEHQIAAAQGITAHRRRMLISSRVERGSLMPAASRYT